MRFVQISLHRLKIVLSFMSAAALFSMAGGAVFAAGNAEARTITVTGQGSASSAPDIAVVRLGVESRNADVKAALAEAAARTKAVIAAIEGNGVAGKDIATVDYNLGFVSTAQGRPSSAGNVDSSGNTAGPAGYYRVTDVAAVTVTDLTRLGSILDAALGAGANEVQGISFQLADSSGLAKQARKAAFEDAHAKALQLAQLAGVPLGGVLTVSSGGEGRPAPVSTFRAAALAAPAVNPGTLEVSVNLEVVYSIGK